MELWSTETAAQHWDVAPSRARAIIASRHIGRISGYPADQIRAVTRRQGARTDLAFPAVPFTTALSLAETASSIAETFDHQRRLRIFFEFVRGADDAGPQAPALVVSEPGTTADDRFDALLGAAAEHLCARYGRPGPLWSVAVDRFLDTPWWVSDLTSGRLLAALWTPASFLRRGIFLDRHDLTQDGTQYMPEPVFDRSALNRAFTMLASKLERRGIVGHVHVVGGAAMLLAYDTSRVTTRDIDALSMPDGPMVDAIREVADDMGWPTTWLNNQAKSYVSRTPGEGSLVFDHPYLQVAATSAEHPLAMKVLAARAVRDSDDIRVLLARLRLTTVTAVLAIVDRYFPGIEIPDRSRLLLEDLLDQP